MTREELRKKFEKLCDRSNGCYGCPCEGLRVCNEILCDELTDADYEEGIKALEDYEKSKVDKSIGDGSKIILHATEEPTQGPEYDVVSKPQHYTSTSIECIDAMRETQGDEAVKAFCVCNAFKYLWRHNRKNGDEDIKKANWYLNKAVEIMEGEKDDN